MTEKNEIIDYINRKYNENVPSPVKFVVRRKAKKIETFQTDEMPLSLQNCTVEQFILIVKEALKQGKLNL